MFRERVRLVINHICVCREIL
ncbi:hypothetical protein RDI58_029308 [Solanum bulbocastanum]|uniref:Uncharacterized protein n=1 Tax=Solanum bulbocastanum TaxID=147425 RepID=A0AAN8XZT6_SOLBU